MEFMVATNIPWNTLNNPNFRQFLQNCISGKYSNVVVPSESTLRKNYLPTEHNRVKTVLKNQLSGSKIWISVDETTDALDQAVACVVVGALDETRMCESHIYALKQLEVTNAETIANLIHSCLRELWDDKYEQNVDKLLLFITDAAPYMVRAGKLLKQKYGNMLHMTCLAHALHRVAEAVRDNFCEVDQLISNMKRVFRKAPHRINMFRQILPHIPLPPAPVLTRWGTWLEATSYYYSYFNDIKRVIDQLDDKEAQSISRVKESFANPNITNDLSYIHACFSRIPLAIKQLENSSLSAIEAMNIVFDLRQYLFQLSGEGAEKIKTKFETVLNRNPGFRTIWCVVDLLSGKEVNVSSPEVNVASLRNYTHFKYAPLTSVNVERAFSTMKWIFSDKRRRLTAEHLEHLFVIYCNKNKPNIENKDYYDE